MTNPKPIRRIAIIGTGVIGASWAALFLAKGLQVVATDIAPNAETALRKSRRCLATSRTVCSPH
ncbi:3-hydroxyacyl-CoA dehydrogenase NAD-binding domain-containing protein [Burkholderia sp. Bp8963]|uniref:3-hydroxyacyl-CoA dehydrogenase NAD-binding domain-containing protein n=1 Tax=Burkholderia sp. Bp8963 TaxID=2184547 RepID=UPI0026A66DEE|nr:3-hydroxyacyl-CoA dehydrogenase NAD-binding domain-containing protein [Burkholderia sp. Bp8963]